MQTTRLLSLFCNDKFRLSRLDGADEPDVCLERVVETGFDGKREKPESYYNPVRPFPLTLTTGAIFSAILLGAIAVIAWLKMEERARTGLSRSSENFEVLQFLGHYIPTVFATLVESLWVLLNRLLCVMQPFRELWAGQAKSSRTIDTTHSAIPPQLSFWRVMRACHYVLALVCMNTLVVNLLGVGLSALFNEKQTTAKYHTFEPIMSTAFNNDAIYNDTSSKKSHQRVGTKTIFCHGEHFQQTPLCPPPGCLPATSSSRTVSTTAKEMPQPTHIDCRLEVSAAGQTARPCPPC